MTTTGHATDWATAEALRYAVICRKHGLKCRVVPCHQTDTYLAIYREGEDFDAKRKAAKAEAHAAGWTGFEKILQQVQPIR